MSFRLLHIETMPERPEPRRWIRPPNDSRNPLPGRSIDFVNIDQYDQSMMSIILGNNGTGKSRLLRDIALAFISIKTGGGRKFPLRKLVYTLNGDSYSIQRNSDGVFGRINSMPVDLDFVATPSKIITMTVTPFDKFPLPLNDMGKGFDYYASRKRFADYEYMGLRDNTRRSSPTSLVNRSVARLFEVLWTEDRTEKDIESVFSFLKYRPWLKVVYRFRKDPELIKRIEERISGRYQIDETEEESTLRADRVWTESTEYQIIPEEVVNSYRILEQMSGRSSYIETEADFASWRANVSPYQMNAISVLRKLELVSVASVVVKRSTGEEIELTQTSSGEMNILTSFLGLSAVLKDDSIVLIDEPEISLHPKWQNDYLDLLHGCFNGYRGCHYIIATHSPLILSDVSAGESTVVSLDGNTIVDGAAYSGKSSDFLLVNAFGVANGDNYYLKTQLSKALRMAAEGDTKSQEFNEAMAPLLKVLPNIPSSARLSEVIKGLQDATREIE